MTSGSLLSTGFDPSSTKAIVSAKVVKIITNKEIKGEHEYNALIDVLYDKIFSLLENRFDDSIKGYKDNQIKHYEMKKYIRSKVRA